MKNKLNKQKNDDEKINDTKSNISQNESHQPLNSELQQNINFRLLNSIGGNLSKNGQKQDQHPSKHGSQKNQSNNSQKKIPSNKEYKEDQKNHSSFSNQNSNDNSSFQSSLISDKKSSNSKKKSGSNRAEEKKNDSKQSKKKSKISNSKSSKSNENSSNLSSSARNSKKSNSKKGDTNRSNSKNSDEESGTKSEKSNSKSDESSSNSKSSDKSDSESNSESKSSKSDKEENSKSNSNTNTNRDEHSLNEKATKKNEDDDKKTENNGGEETEEEEEDEFEDDNNKVENEEKEHRKLFKREKICDTDTEDEESENEKEIPWIILPDNPYKKMWDLLVAFLILYSAIITPYEIAFSDTNNVSWFEILIDILLGIDIVLTFFSAYTDDEENLVKNHKKIVKKYLKSWFIVDIISVLPISYLFKQGKYSGLTKISKLPKLYRLVKLTKLLRITKMSSKGNLNKVTKFFMEKLKINANVERLFFFVLTFLLMNHLCACFWYFMAKIEDFSPDSWVVRLGYIDSSNLELYIISFYWTLTTVTTVGYGDITAGTTIERIYNLFIMSFGVLLYSFAIGSLSSIVSTLDQKSEEMNQKLQILSSIKKEFNLEQNIYDKVRKVIKYDLSRNQKDKMVFLQELPNKLRIELSQIMHDKVIQNFYFFRDQPSDFFAYVAPLLKPVKFSQNDYLYKCQDMIDEMYFVAKGTVIFCLEKRYGEKEIREIKKNNNFGEIEMCLNEKLSFNIKIKSRNCELFVLKKNDFLRLSVNFKEFIESFLHKSLMKYLKFNEEKNKMMKEFDSLINADEGEEGEEENEDSEEEDEEGEEEEENENEEKALESIDEEGGSSSEGGSEESENDKDKSQNNEGEEGSDKEKKESNESGNEKESQNEDSNEKSKSNESDSSKNSDSKSDDKSNKNSESKENSNNDGGNDSSYAAPDGQDIIKMNKN
jgi:CRP-like cAMP-binding protein